MKSIVYVKQDKRGNEQAVYVSEPIDMNESVNNLPLIISKMQIQRSQIIKERLKTYVDMFFK